jgi:DNA-binding response OmpR family regulator
MTWNRIMHKKGFRILFIDYAGLFFVDDKEVSLTQREFELLVYLMKNKGNVCTRVQIIEDVWDIHFEYDTGVIDVFMNAIRKKLNLSKENDCIKTKSKNYFETFFH